MFGTIRIPHIEMIEANLMMFLLAFALINVILHIWGKSWIMTWILYGIGGAIAWFYWHGYWIDYWVVGVFVASVVGFTNNQRAWILKRDQNRCQFHRNVGGVWVRCRNRKNLQVHHIIPRGWAARHLPNHFPINGPNNGITLCDAHHVGDVDYYDEDFVVHPDTTVAKQSYRQGNKQAYKEMMDNRKKLNESGMPYWNTRWDWMFTRIARKQTSKYLRQNPDDKYPTNGRRGNTGREPK